MFLSASNFKIVSQHLMYSWDHCLFGRQIPTFCSVFPRELHPDQNLPVLVSRKAIDFVNITGVNTKLALIGSILNASMEILYNDYDVILHSADEHKPLSIVKRSEIELIYEERTSPALLILLFVFSCPFQPFDLVTSSQQ